MWLAFRLSVLSKLHLYSIQLPNWLKYWSFMFQISLFYAGLVICCESVTLLARVLVCLSVCLAASYPLLVRMSFCMHYILLVSLSVYPPVLPWIISCWSVCLSACLAMSYFLLVFLPVTLYVISGYNNFHW